jgi:uncharacterized protein (TIGR02996 family)
MRHEGFLQAICETPDDDAPRLIYADWLQDNGDPERAEFIRVQVQRVSLDPDDPGQRALFARERELQARHGGAWLAELPVLKGVRWGRRGKHPRLYFERGFVAGAQFGSFAALRASESAMLEAAPLRWVELRRVPVMQVAPLARWPGLARVRGLILRENDAANTLVRLLPAATHRLEHLDIAQGYWHNRPGPDLDDHGLRYLTTSPAFSALKSLNLAGQSWTTRRLERFASAPALAGLRQLTIGAIRGRDLHLLAEGSGFPSLDSLDLICDCGRPRQQLGEFLAAPWLSNLRRLVLPDMGFSQDDIPGGVLAQPRLAQLRCLDLPESVVGKLGELASSPHLGRLVFLRFGNPDLKLDEFAALVNSTALAELRELHLSGASLRGAHIDCLRRRTGLPRLELFSIGRASEAMLARLRAACPALEVATGSEVPSAYIWSRR